MRRSLRASALAVALALALFAPRVASADDAAAGADDGFPVAGTTRIDTIEVRGLARTKEYVVLREVQLRPGSVVDRGAWDLAITRLWNTALFSRVAGRLEIRDGKNIAVYELEERWTLIPTLGFQSGGGVFYLQVGASDTNTLGHFIETGGYYERFNQFNGGQISIKDPRFLGRRIETVLLGERTVRPRDDFAVLRTRAHGEAYVYAWKDRIRYGGSTDVFEDRFLPNGDKTGPYASTPPIDVTLESVSFRIGRIDTIRLRRSGASLEVVPQVAVTSHPSYPVFERLEAEVLAFWMLGERWNLAFRTFAGSMSAAPMHLTYFLGGLDVVRGIKDSSVITRAFVASNAEVRFTAFDSTWVAVMPTVFADAAAARLEDASRLLVYSAGGGLRLIVPKLAGVLVRADVAVPLYVTPTVGFNFGIGQFF